MMKNRHTRILRYTVLVGASLLPLVSIRAQTFTYTNCDLVAGFRLTGGASDLVINLGSVASFESLPARSVLAITNLSATQLASALPSLDGVSWSVSGAMRGNTNYSYPLQTLWVTAPRLNLYTAGPAWVRQSVWTLGGAASQIDAIGVGAATYGNGQPAGPDNSSTGVLIPPASRYAYTSLVGSLGNFDGTFQGGAENTTPEDFDSAGLPSRSVLYRLLPATATSEGAPGVVLGFFDFKPDATLTFTAGPPPEQTNIRGINVREAVATVEFPTVNLVGYRLRYTDSVGLATPISSWNIGANIIGDGTVLSLQDTNAASIRFYTVEAY